MRVHQAQPLETSGCRSETVQAGNQDPFMIADNDHADFPLPVNQEADLTIDGTGQGRNFPRQLMADQNFRSDAAAVEILQ